MKQEEKNSIIIDSFFLTILIIGTLSIITSIGYQNYLEQNTYKEFCQNKGYEYKKHTNTIVTCINNKTTQYSGWTFVTEHKYKISKHAGTITSPKQLNNTGKYNYTYNNAKIS